MTPLMLYLPTHQSGKACVNCEKRGVELQIMFMAKTYVDCIMTLKMFVLMRYREQPLLQLLLLVLW